jgi:hypothetical protein
MHESHLGGAADAAKAILVAINGGVELVVAAQSHQCHISRWGAEVYILILVEGGCSSGHYGSTIIQAVIGAFYRSMGVPTKSDQFSWNDCLLRQSTDHHVCGTVPCLFPIRRLIIYASTPFY